MSWIEDNQRKPRILVIIIGEARGGNLAWKSLHKFLLQPLNAHLAIYISELKTRTYLHDISQYIWTVPEDMDWSIVFDTVAEMCNMDNVAGKWRNYCDMPGIFMGGIPNCSHESHTSVSFAFRWLVQQKIVKLHLLDKYDWFILTRADQLYLCDHHDFTEMIEGDALLPIGEYYGGWSDRHIIGKSFVFMKLLNLTTELVCRPDYWFPILQSVETERNIETIQKIIWDHMNLTVSEFSRSMFTVRTPYDTSSWSEGQFHPETNAFGLKVKYPKELKASMKYCKIKNITNALKSLHQYDRNT